MYIGSTQSRSAPLAALIASVSLLIGTPLASAQLPAKVGDTPVPSLAPMIKRVSPAVVNIATKGTIQEAGGRSNPLMEDPFFRRFFDIPEGPRERQFQSAGSGVIVDAKNVSQIVPLSSISTNASSNVYGSGSTPSNQSSIEPTDNLQKLEQLKKMLDAGLITQEDYNSTKNQILSRI